MIRSKDGKIMQNQFHDKKQRVKLCKIIEFKKANWVMKAVNS